GRCGTKISLICTVRLWYLAAYCIQIILILLRKKGRLGALFCGITGALEISGGAGFTGGHIV
ncbi:MAG: hypothetical protein M0O99_05315, partial [Desulfuromonas thiophila]|nr:hypothetical protein [Desulfuromonas thiophila]